LAVLPEIALDFWELPLEAPGKESPVLFGDAIILTLNPIHALLVFQELFEASFLWFTAAELELGILILGHDLEADIYLVILQTLA